MANEATLNVGLSIRKISEEDGQTILMDYRPPVAAFTADVDGTNGPTPGAIQVTNVGRDISLAQLSVPGFYVVRNIDTDLTNWVEWGIWDPETATFYPLNMCYPGESFPARFSLNVAHQYGTGPGSGATGPLTNRVRFRSLKATCRIVVEAFEA